MFLHIRWQESDLSNLETHPLTPGLRMAKPTTEPSSITTVTTAAQSRTDALPTPESNSSLPAPSPGNTARGVPTGIKAGISAGVGAVVLLLVMTAIFFIKRYRSNRIKQTEQPEPETAMEATDTAMTGPGELDSKPSEKAQRESPRNQVINAPGRKQPLF